MVAISVPPDASASGVLPGAQFADAFRLTVRDSDLDAIAASKRVFERAPAWVAALLRLRNTIVAPLGLRGTDDPIGQSAPRRIGWFPVVSETPDRVVLGFNDKHLDFRIVVDSAADSEGGRQITATTLVRRHNVFGRAYLAAVMPFHKVIVPTMLMAANRR